MIIIRTLLTTLNILLLAALLYFTRDLDWGNEADHASIIGFALMMLVIVADTAMVLLG